MSSRTTGGGWGVPVLGGGSRPQGGPCRPVAVLTGAALCPLPAGGDDERAGHHASGLRTNQDQENRGFLQPFAHEEAKESQPCGAHRAPTLRARAAAALEKAITIYIFFKKKDTKRQTVLPSAWNSDIYTRLVIFSYSPVFLTFLEQAMPCPRQIHVRRPGGSVL